VLPKELLGLGKQLGGISTGQRGVCVMESKIPQSVE